MRSLASLILVLATALGLAPMGEGAEEAGISAKLHPWGLFDPGAWKTVHVVTETFNEHGQRVSACASDTKTTLVDIDNDGVTIETQACMEVAGKTISGRTAERPARLSTANRSDRISS